jgi:fibronectin-binding autotransporter adhesin
MRYRGDRSGAVTTQILAAASVATIALLVAAPAAAQTAWTGSTSNDWTDASNWSNGLPDSSDGTTINSGIANPTVLGVSGAATGATNGLILSGTAGSLTVRNGSTLSSATAAIGSGVGSVGAVTVTGSGSHWTTSGPLSAGGTGMGTLNIESGGMVTALAGVRLGFSATGAGTLNVKGGSVLETTGLTKGAGGAAATFDNATLRALSNNATFTGALGINQLTIAAGGLTIDTNSHVIGAEGFGGAGGLSVTGSGELTLGGASTYAGETRIATGSTLVLSGNGSIAATSGIVVDGTFDITAITAGGISAPRLAGTGAVVFNGKTLTADVISPGGDGSTGTLTLSGDYVGTGNTLLIDTVLGDDTSDTDRLVIFGTTSGTTNVAVTNMGGVGGVTATGIKIVDVSGASDGIFSLLGDTVHNGEQAVIGGAYLYGLYQEGGDGDWYLRNIIDDEPVFQPAAPVIEAYVAAALQAFNTTESLQQRIGNRTWSAGSADGLWGRIEVGQVSIAPDSTTGASYDVTTWQLQAGLDGVLSQSEAGKLVAGVNAQFGIISADISSASGIGSVASNGYGLGATLTWYGNEGFYLDAQGKLTWFDSTLDSETLGTTIVSGNAGFGYALGIEAGQQIALGENWSVTPQAQLAYSAVDFDEFVSYGSTVALKSGDSLLGRLGISVDHESAWQDAAGSTRLYGIANLTYEFLEGTATSIGGDTLSSKADPLWGSLGLGGSINWAGDQLSLYGEANFGTSLNAPGDSYSLGITAGIRGKL